MSENGKIILTAEDGSEEVFFVMEKAAVAGGKYLLVAASEEENADALLLKEEHTQADEIRYRVVEDEKELTIISKYFEELLEDVELRLE